MAGSLSTAWMKAEATWRAADFAAGATESSRSTITTSAPDRKAFSSFFCESPGTNSSERISGGLLMDHRLAAASGDEVAGLVEGAVLEFDDAAIRPRLRFAHADHFRFDMHRIAVKQRVREGRLGHAEIGDCRAQRGFMH